MSLGVATDPEPTQTAELRALAHPLRLRMLSLLTGAALTAAELARELEVTHANASYHLRQLLAAGLIKILREERIRGGRAKRYRYDLDRTDRPEPNRPDDTPGDRSLPAERQPVLASLAIELQRRAARRGRGTGHVTDAELWVEPQVWDAALDRVRAASVDLHRAARPPRTPGTIRVSATIALFPMEPDR